MSYDQYDTRISKVVLQDITDVSVLSSRYDRTRDKDFSDTRLARKLGTIAHGELLINQQYILLDQNYDRDAKLLHIPELGKSRHESRLSVAFGQLVIRQPSREQVSELVAVKYTSSSQAAREYAATNTVRKRMSDGSAYTPLGFIKHNDRARNNTGLLTRYRHEVLTLDSVFWNDAATTSQRLAATTHAALWLSMLHENDIAHGDAEPKNIAFSSDETPVYVDLETAHDLGDPQVFRSALELSDISDFVRYQDQPLSPEELELFIDTYLSSRSNNGVSTTMINEIAKKPLMPIHHFGSPKNTI